MPDLIIPEGEELQFHDALMEDRLTMAQVQIPDGLDPASWKDTWASADPRDRLYRQVYCDGCGYSVGEASYERIGTNRAALWLLIMGDMREAGYGRSALKLIAAEACRNGIELFEVQLKEQSPYEAFILHRGFKKTETREGWCVYTGETRGLAEQECCENVCELFRDNKG